MDFIEKLTILMLNYLYTYLILIDSSLTFYFLVFTIKHALKP